MAKTQTQALATGICKKHEFDEVFNATDVGHKPIRVCGRCKMGFDIKEGVWYSPKELDKIKSGLRYMRDRFVGK